jgi:hypothetical protein
VFASLTALLLATLAMTWPLPVSLSTHLPGYTDHPGLQGDLFFQWNLQRQMREGRLDHMASPYTLHPTGERFRAKVVFSLHLGLYALLMMFFDLFTAHNIAVLLILFSNAVAAWLLFRERSSSGLLAIGCALLFAFGPWVQLKLDQGFVQKITLFHLPLFVLFLTRALDRRRWQDAGWCGLFLVVGALVYPPFAIFDVVLATALIAPAIGASRRRGRPGRLLVGLAAVLLLIFILVWIVGRDDFVAGDRLALSLESFRSQGGYLDLCHPIRGVVYHGTFGDRPFQTLVERLPLGIPIVPLALACVAAFTGRSSPRWLLGLSLGLVILMAGPYLMCRGELVTVNGRPVPLPFVLLEQLPFSQAFRFPIRAFPWLVLALLLASCEAVDWLRAKIADGDPKPAATRGAAVAAAILIVVEPLIVFPEYRGVHVERPRPPSSCNIDRADPNGAVLHLPFYPPSPHEYLMAAVLCDRPIVNAWQRNPTPLAIPAPDAGPDRIAAFRDQLASAGVEAVVLHPEAYGFYETHPDLDEPSLGRRADGFTGDDVRNWLERSFGAAEPRGDRTLVFAVRSSDSTDG